MSGKFPRAAVTAGILATGVAAGLLTAAPAAQAVIGGPAADGKYTFTAKIDIGGGERACSGVLVAPQWIATAASCFAADPQQSAPVVAGKPALKSVATIGRTDLTTTGGQTGEIVELVPRAGRDLVLARLAKPTTGITPVALAAAPVAQGEALTVTGYGRTKAEWVPNRLNTSAFTVDAVNPDTLALTGAAAGAAICQGDTGGPAVREKDGKTELVAVSSRSWQGGCLGTDETRTGAVSSRVDDLKAWVDSTVAAARPTDFNCDGQRDIAVGDPQATVGGDAKAGLVRIIYGGGKGTAEINQDLDAVPGGSEASDYFGETLAVFDHNLDGCTDLVVGVPAEDLGTATDAGMVQVLYGAPAGLTKGKASLNLEQGTGSGAIKASASEAGDRMGHALAAGATTAGEPYLLIGMPGEDLGDVANAGSTFYLRGTTNAAVHQDKTGVSGAVEKDDRFGTTVAASPEHIAIGAPGEAIEAKTTAGGVEILSHKLNAEGLPTSLVGLNQDSDAVNGGAETGDQFGAGLAMVPYRTSATAPATQSIVAIGSPGEDSATVKDAGRVVTLRVSATGMVAQIADINQDATDVLGVQEESDNFGRYLSAVATTPGAVSTAQNTLLAVGIPNEDIGTAADAGSITVFPLLGAPGASDVAVEPGKAGLPGTSGAGQRLGTSITATGTHLYVGMPYGPAATGAVHTVPWANVFSGTATEPVTTYRPGQGGLPAAGEVFGSAIR
ncbi:S1 family peptidase [Streptomyces ficellus]|uniref:S1 family peptidase n=1 Tax=Streptomyces ficellus TaxID=1977088 RepID=A0ABT7YZA7_9ACTN|nr:S1 family peptidase [Streptomyces ficellus]MDN3292578.1 S1 family peptidase [Streptomyces ficellus]